MKVAVIKTILWALSPFFLFMSGSQAAKEITEGLIEIHGISDYVYKTFFVTLAYLCAYMGSAAIFEVTNPKQKTETRLNSIRREIELGVWAMIGNVSYALFWLWIVDPYLPFYNFFGNHEWSLGYFLVGTLVYLFGKAASFSLYSLFLYFRRSVFDTWFYWTHRLLHTSWFMKRVHSLHVSSQAEVDK